MKKIFMSCFLLSLFTRGLGQTEKLLLPSDLKQQTIVTEPVTLSKGFFRAGLLMDYRIADRFFNDSCSREYFRESAFGSKSAYGITLQYGISDRFEMYLMTEYLYSLQEVQNSETDAVTNITVTTLDKRKGLGLGDSHLALKYQFIREAANKTSLTGRFELTIPTGEKNPRNIKSENQYDLPVGDGTFAIGLNLLARRIAYPYSFSGYLGYRYNFNGKKIFSSVDQVERAFRFGNLLEAGINGNIHLNEWIVFGNEINFYNEAEGEIENTPTPLMPASWAISYEPGLVFQVHRFRVSESVRIPVKGRNVPADPLYVLMAQYVF